MGYSVVTTNKVKNKIGNSFIDNMSTNINFSKTKTSKIIKSGGIRGVFLGRLDRPTMKVAFPVPKNILLPLGLEGPASATDADIQKRIYDKEAKNWGRNEFSNIKWRYKWYYKKILN